MSDAVGQGLGSESFPNQIAANLFSFDSESEQAEPAPTGLGSLQARGGGSFCPQGP